MHRSETLRKTSKPGTNNMTVTDIKNNVTIADKKQLIIKYETLTVYYPWLCGSIVVEISWCCTGFTWPNPSNEYIIAPLGKLSYLQPTGIDQFTVTFDYK